LLQLLMLNQNFHLVHHLWPRIPWFRYGEAADMADVAVANHRASVSSGKDGAGPERLSTDAGAPR
jgi:fatty acid desaturase